MVVIGSEHHRARAAELEPGRDDLCRRPAHRRDRRHRPDPDALLARHCRRRERLARDVTACLPAIDHERRVHRPNDRTATDAADEDARPPAQPGDEVRPESRAPSTALQEDLDNVRARARRLPATACCARRAEFDNYRKRVERERRAARANSPPRICSRTCCRVVDDLERALARPTPTRRLRRGARRLSRRRRADPSAVPRAAAQAQASRRSRRSAPTSIRNVHQAVSQEPSSTHREGEVIEELRRGYKLGDRLLRPAMVKVAARE